MIEKVIKFIAWWSLRRVARAGAGAVAASNAVISYEALSATASSFHSSQLVSALFPLAADGIVAVATPATIVLRGAPWWVRLQVWALLVAAVGVSVVGNAARAPHVWAGAFMGAPIPSGDALWLSIPPLMYAGSLHTLGLMHRWAPVRTPVPVRAPRAARAPRGQRPAGARVRLPDGREVSPGHARKLRARQRAPEVSSAA